METLSHEMIETMTDAGGTGERDWSTFVNTTEDEVGDICEVGSIIGDPGITRVLGPHPFLITQVDSYFSDATCSCVPSWGSTAATFPLNLSLNSAGAMQVQLNSPLVGVLPADIGTPTAAAPLTTNTPYLSLTATNQAGTLYAFGEDVLDTRGPEQVVQLSQWDGHTVTGAVPTTFASYCDSLTLTAWNPTGGVTSTAQTTFGSTLTITLSVPSAANTGVPVTVQGVVRDGNGIPVQHAPVTLSDAQGGTFMPASGIVTNANGAYTATFTPVAGSDSVTATTTDCSGNPVSMSRPVTGCDIASGIGASDAGSTGGMLGLLLGCAAWVRRRMRRLPS
jgi:hypothetical protein